MRATCALYISCLALAACSSAAPAAPSPVAPPGCDDGWRAAADGVCEPLVAACPDGTRPARGAERCAKVGPASCGAGFVADGFGCAAIAPDAPCEGATRDVLGAKACAPIGDCAAPFPPAGAVIVDPKLSDGALDATHVRTLADAVAKGGDVYALEAGDHKVTAIRLAGPATIVGRCAARTRLVPEIPGGRGLEIAARIAIRGVTLSGFRAAATAVSGGDLTLTDVLVEAASYRGLMADAGGKILAERTVVRGTHAVPASEITVAVIAGGGGSVRLVDAALASNEDAAIVATDGPASIELTRTIVRDTRRRGGKIGGSAVRAFEAGTVTVEDSALLDSRLAAVLTFRRKKPPPVVTIRRSTIERTLASDETGTELGLAVHAALGAQVALEDVTVRATKGWAAYVADDASLDAVRTAFVDAKQSRDLHGYGLGASHGGKIRGESIAVVDIGSVGVNAASGATIALSRSLVLRVGGEEQAGLPMGAGAAASSGATVTLDGCAIVDAKEVGASAYNAGSVVTLADSVITSTGMWTPRFGHGVLVVDHGAGRLRGAVVERQRGAGILLAGGGALVERSFVRGNEVGVQAQEGSSLEEASLAPADAPPDQVGVIVKPTRLTDNRTRIGAGALPLPAPPLTVEPKGP